MWGYAEGIDFADVITLPWAAGFSAFGAACAEYMHRYDRGSRMLLPNDMSEDARAEAAREIDGIWRELENEAREEMSREEVDTSKVTFRYGVSARYIGQLESFETRLDFGTMRGPGEIDRMIEAFESMYRKLYPEGARFPDAGYSLTAIHLEAIAPKPQPVLRERALEGATPKDSAYVETREVYHRDAFTPFRVYEMQELAPGNVVEGPAIIRDPMTTVVVPPGKRMEFDAFGILHYR